MYQLCFGGSEAERARLGLPSSCSVKDFRALNRSRCFVAGVRDEDEHTRTCQAMAKSGLRPIERCAAFIFSNLSIGAAVLTGMHLCGASSFRK
jgi:myosin heavy subunit